MISEKTSFLFYAATGVGKSTQAKYIAQYVWDRYKKKTRFIALDTGSLWAPVQSLVDKGIVIPCQFPTSYEYNPYALMRKFRRGMWPKDGIVNMPEEVIVRDVKGQVAEIKYLTHTEWSPWTVKETEEIGAIVVDSLTTFATAYMSDAKQKNVRMSGDSAGTVRREDGEVLGSNTQNHYADAHTETLDAVNAFQNLPVHITMFTALEDLGTDDSSGTKKMALGPATVGKAIVSVLPQRVQNNFHMQAEGVGDQRKIKAWYHNHPSDIQNLLWPAKVGVETQDLPAFWKRFPGGFIPLDKDRGIGDYLDWREQMKAVKKGAA